MEDLAINLGVVAGRLSKSVVSQQRPLGTVPSPGRAMERLEQLTEIADCDNNNNGSCERLLTPVSKKANSVVCTPSIDLKLGRQVHSHVRIGTITSDFGLCCASVLGPCLSTLSSGKPSGRV